MGINTMSHQNHVPKTMSQPNVGFIHWLFYQVKFNPTRSKVDHYVYCKKVGEHFIYVVLYIDDMLMVGNNMEVIKEVKT